MLFCYVYNFVISLWINIDYAKFITTEESRKILRVHFYFSFKHLYEPPKFYSNGAEHTQNG